MKCPECSATIPTGRAWCPRCSTPVDLVTDGGPDLIPGVSFGGVSMMPTALLVNGAVAPDIGEGVGLDGEEMANG